MLTPARMTYVIYGEDEFADVFNASVIYSGARRDYEHRDSE